MAEGHVEVPRTRLISAEEERLIATLEKRFQGELSGRAVEGGLPASFVGQFALARALRGNNGDLDETDAWLTTFLKKASESGLGALAAEMTRALDGSTDGVPLDTMLPYAGEVGRYIRAVFTAPKRSPDGGPVNYIPLARFNKRSIYMNIEWSHFVRYMQGATALRVVEVDRLCHKLGKAVQVVTIFDLAGCGFSDLVCPKFDMAYAADVATFQTQVAAEIFGPVYILNAPGFVLNLAGVLFRLLPERFKKKLHLMRGNGLEDPGFVRLAGGEEQLRRLLSMRDSMGSEPLEERRPEAPGQEPQRTLDLGPRQALEHSVEVLPGQKVVWSFEVLPGPGDRLFGGSDVAFSARGLWTAEAGEARGPSGTLLPEERRQLLRRLGSMRPEALVPPQRVAAGKRRAPGSHAAERPGVVTLRWSNEHSLARGKAIRYSVQVVPGEGPSRPSQRPTAKAAAVKEGTNRPGFSCLACLVR